MSELSGKELHEISKPQETNYTNIVPEKQMSSRELNDAVKEEFNKVSEYKDVRSNDAFEKSDNLDVRNTSEYFTTSEERKELAQKGKGEWRGGAGDSLFVPDDAKAKQALKEYKQEGIEYKDGEPNFENVSEATVKIDNMTSERYGPSNNFDQANHKCAEKWNAELKDGRNDWTAREVENWRKENHYTWHERLDRKTMDLVQSDIHSECKHYGGVAECRRYEKANGGGFDE